MFKLKKTKFLKKVTKNGYFFRSAKLKINCFKKILENQKTT